MSLRTFFVGVAFVASLASFIGVAGAQGGGDGSRGVGAGDDDAGTRDQEARARFTAGVIAFDAGRFDDALGDFQRAYELSGRPELLYNVGLAAYRLRDDALALESFERFIELAPDNPDVDQARGRVRTIRNQQRAGGAGDSEASPSDSPSPSSSSTGEGAPSRVGPWVLGLAGGGLAIGGAVLLGIALSDKNEIESMTGPVSWPQIEDQVNSVPVLSGVGIALISVGVAAAAGAVLWRVLTPTAEVSVSVGAGNILVKGRF